MVDVVKMIYENMFGLEDGVDEVVLSEMRKVIVGEDVYGLIMSRGWFSCVKKDLSWWDELVDMRKELEEHFGVSDYWREEMGEYFDVIVVSDELVGYFVKKLE